MNRKIRKKWTNKKCWKERNDGRLKRLKRNEMMKEYKEKKERMNK